MALPNLTPEQRAAALEKAAAARATRATVKRELKAGALKLSDVISRAETDDALAKLKVAALLEAMPGVGKATAHGIMAEVGISAARRVRGLGPHQREALVTRFG